MDAFCLASPRGGSRGISDMLHAFDVLICNVDGQG